MRGDRKAVPAPEIALARDEPLAGLEQCREARPVGALDDADLGEPARELRRCLHIAGERGDAVRQVADRTDRAPRPPSASARIDRPARRDRRRARRPAPSRSPCRRRARPLPAAKDSCSRPRGACRSSSPRSRAFAAGARRHRAAPARRRASPRAGVADFRGARRALRSGKGRLCGRERFRQLGDFRRAARRSPPGRTSMLPSSASSRAARSA